MRTFIEWCQETFGTPPLVTRGDVPVPMATIPHDAPLTLEDQKAIDAANLAAKKALAASIKPKPKRKAKAKKTQKKRR